MQQQMVYDDGDDGWTLFTLNHYRLPQGSISCWESEKELVWLDFARPHNSVNLYLLLSECNL